MADLHADMEGFDFHAGIIRKPAPRGKGEARAGAGRARRRLKLKRISV